MDRRCKVMCLLCARVQRWILHNWILDCPKIKVNVVASVRVIIPIVRIPIVEVQLLELCIIGLLHNWNSNCANY